VSSRRLPNLKYLADWINRRDANNPLRTSSENGKFFHIDRLESRADFEQFLLVVKLCVNRLEPFRTR
jgi:hypothetical protein